MRLENKVAIITGGSSGIGEAIAKLFAKEGAQVAIVGRRLKELERVTQEINNNGGNAIFINADISNNEDVQKIFRKTIEQYGTFDILVNNAGITGRRYGDGPTHSCEPSALDKILDTNLKGTFTCSKYALQEFLNKNEGIIINMSSVLGLVGCHDYFNSHVYQMTKAAIIQLTRSMAAYYGKYNIRVNVVAPGFVVTNATERVAKNEETMEFVYSKQLMKGNITVEDVAKGALYLASDESAFVTGHTLIIDGGWAAQ
ncbi:MAG TPA: SDR family oxidoreductase [Clostridia bacterium]|nr:SDR family oxidoreductase [Clostridia bacterium]